MREGPPGNRHAWKTRGLFAGSLLLFFFGAHALPNPVQSKPASQEAADVFESKIRPILQSRCIVCHGPDLQSKNLRLDQPVSQAIAQRLVEVLSYTSDVKMPPSGKLPADELALLTKWAEAGAPWPATPKVAPSSGSTFWAFVPPTTPPVPEVKDKRWAQNPIDAFVLAKLEQNGLQPAPSADRRTLIRRATFDLTGLPPTPEEIDAFLADKEPNAFERVVDRLLASPAYGERWGRHWLDVARYADSNGLDENLVYPNAWRYRDWVIAAMNADKPIDEFLQEQLAGDLIPGAGNDGIVATGFLAMGGKMLAEDDPVKQELDVIDEQIDTFTKTYLGLTVACARCHDHKFDPIKAKDYYALAGIFKSTKTMLNYKNMAEWNERPLGTPAEQEKLLAIEARLRETGEEARKKRQVASDALLKLLQPQLPAYETAARKVLELEKGRSPLKPAVPSPDGAAPKEALVREAEDFVAGNVSKDVGGFGKGIGVLVNKGEYPNRTEYEITVPSGGPYQLDLRYASGDPRPIRVYANGALALSNAAGKVSGGFNPEHQKWFAEGILVLQQGKNRIKFERESYFPHLDKLLLIPRPGQPPTEVLGGIAEEAHLIPEIVRDVADRIKNGIDVRIELPEKADGLFPEAVQQELKKLDDEMAALQKEKPDLPRAMAVGEGQPENLKVHLRGSYLTLGEECPRRFPTVVAGVDQPPIPPEHSGRLELAKWVTDGKNPLTARVFVNRVWRWRFGRGLVATVDNFGAVGELPTHPELLDWLATTFVNEDDWSLKKFHKRLMLTNTYQMSSRYDEKAAEADPDDHLLWRFPRQRLEAEAIRDSILFVSGTLDRTMGGTLITLKPRAYVTSTANSDPIQYDSVRRSVYLPVIRSALYDVYTAFDFGDPTVTNGDRPSTTVAPQALFMLNSAVVLNATRALAEALLGQKGMDDAQRVRKLYLSCYGRPATDPEVAGALAFLKRFQSAYAKAEDPRLSAWQSLCKAFIAANEFIYVE
ncbi:MAG: DUF1549 domain-containing protein [Fimbriimonadaceae bacterium]|nr:DUF1549 domain-containing protein [Fimbriimonadaceae bacterium]